MSIASKTFKFSTIAATFVLTGFAAGTASAASCYNSQWNYVTQSCGVPTNTTLHQYQPGNYQSTSSDNANGLLLLGGLLVGGAILHNILDDDKPQVQTVHHTKPKHPHKPVHARNRAMKRVLELCGKSAVNQAHNRGFFGAEIINVHEFQKRGDRRWAMVGEMTLKHKERVRRNRQRIHNSGNPWFINSGNQWNNGWNQNQGWVYHQPRFVTKTVKQSFKCKVKNGKVRSFSTWR